MPATYHPEQCPSCRAEHVVVEVKAANGAMDRWRAPLACQRCGAAMGSYAAPEEGRFRVYLRSRLPLTHRWAILRHDSHRRAHTDVAGRPLLVWVLLVVAGLALAGVLYLEVNDG